MLRTTLRSLFARKLRLILSALAIVLGVGFVAGTLVLTDTLNRTFDNLFSNIDKNTSVQVRARSNLAGSGADQFNFAAVHIEFFDSTCPRRAWPANSWRGARRLHGEGRGAPIPVSR